MTSGRRHRHDITHRRATDGYGAVLLVVSIASSRVSFLGKTMMYAAIDAGTTRCRAIPLVITVAAVGAILGDSVGCWVGREGGDRLPWSDGCHVRVDECTMKPGHDLFRTPGGKVVFLARSWRRCAPISSE